MLSGFRLETMLDLIRRATLPIEAGHRGSDFGRGDGFEKARGDHCPRRRRLFAAHGSGRRRNARGSQKPATRSDRSELDKGRTLETTGDGMLIEFADAVQAARIAAR